MVVMARLLVPEEFGLVGMVTAVTGILGMFRDAGLSMVTIQRATITDEQISMLFWINMALGVILGGLSIAFAPALVSFYREPRLFWVTVVLAAGFVFNAASTQHQAILQRQMRFVALSVIEILSMLIGMVVGISMAVLGFGYWALVGMAIILQFANTVLVWMTTAWIPGMPRRNIGTRSMLHFGGTVTLNSIVVYLAYNAEKVLLGRFWGADALGIYGRAYQLINLPTEQLNSAVGWVAIPALSRLQEDPKRLRTYFLKGYSLILAITIPVTIACALFADDIIYILLGPKWMKAAVIFRLLAPTVLAFALINPFGWLLWSTGKIRRSLNMALVIAPLVIAGYVAGLRYGPGGVAVGYSAVMTLLIVPMIAWAKHRSPISSRDIWQVVSLPLLSGIVAATLTAGVQFLFGRSLSPLPRILLVTIVLFGSYLWVLLHVMGQKVMYLDLLRELRKRSTDGGEVSAFEAPS